MFIKLQSLLQNLFGRWGWVKLLTVFEDWTEQVSRHS